jgi:hypothetical protein
MGMDKIIKNSQTITKQEGTRACVYEDLIGTHLHFFGELVLDRILGSKSLTADLRS